MYSPKWTGLIEFLQADLAIPQADVTLGIKHCGEQLNLLPMVLWQYGLVTLEQLDQIFDWLNASQV